MIAAQLESPAGPIRWKETTKGIFAQGVIPPEAEYFQDHFPVFPVLPGVLALEIFKRIVEDYLVRKTESKAGSRWRLASLKEVRFSAYLRPGDEWEARLECIHQENERACWKGCLSSRGKSAVQAQLFLNRE